MNWTIDAPVDVLPVLPPLPPDLRALLGPLAGGVPPANRPVSADRVGAPRPRGRPE